MLHNKKWLDPKKLMLEYGIAISTQALYRRKKKIPYSKIGGFIYYNRKKIDAWIESHMIDVEEDLPTAVHSLQDVG